MKWQKIGKIFDPTEHTLVNGCKEFAQAPQTLVFDDFVRIYFSTRQADEGGTYLSHISYAEFTKDFKKVIRVADKPVIALGDLGCYDEHGIFPLNIFKKDGIVHGYISGLNRRASVSIDASIGLATSNDDGLTFTRYGSGPILTSSLHEPFLVCDPFVQYFEGTFHMWYVYGTKWLRQAEADGAPSRVYKIGHATSADGKNWLKEGVRLLDDVLGDDECQALPTVAFYKGRYHMYFCYRQSVDFRKNRQNGYRLGYAYSDDLKNWTRNDSLAGIEVSDKGWDADMMCYPHLFHSEGDLFLLYNGNHFGRSGFGLAKLINE